MVKWEFFALIYLFSVYRCWRFVLDPITVEVALTFAWCACYLHGVWRWVFMLCGDGFILRTRGVLGKGVVSYLI